MHSARSSFLAALAAAGLALAAGAVGTAAPAGARGPQPAFYTWQAPGGAGTAGQRVVALTFDDGPGPYTPQVLSVLERYHVPATFFEVGEDVAAYPQTTRTLAAAGYPVENHTWSHADLATLSAAQVDAQVDEAQRRSAPSSVRVRTACAPPTTHGTRAPSTRSPGAASPP